MGIKKVAVKDWTQKDWNVGVKAIIRTDKNSLTAMANCFEFASNQIEQHKNITPLRDLYAVLPRSKAKLKGYALATLPVSFDNGVLVGGRKVNTFNYKRGKNVSIERTVDYRFFDHKLPGSKREVTLVEAATRFAKTMNKHGWNLDSATDAIAKAVRAELEANGDTADHQNESMKSEGGVTVTRS